MRNVLPADKSLLKNNEFDIIRCNTLKECNSLRSNASGNNCQCFQEIPRKQKLLKNSHLKVSNFKMSFWCHRFDQNSNENIVRISALTFFIASLGLLVVNVSHIPPKLVRT